MTYEIHPEQRDTGVMGEGNTSQNETTPRGFGAMTPKNAIEDVVMRQNSDFYRERVLAYGSWENFLEAHHLTYKDDKVQR